MNIVAILVIYNTKVQETDSFQSLLQNYVNNPLLFRHFKLIIYDNSPTDQKIDIIIPFGYQYIHDPNNTGLAKAYNFALHEAIVSSYNWLLLLDQDSSLPENFIANLADILLNNEKDDTLSAIVPKMRYQNTFFSPSRVLFGGTLRPIDMRYQGICNFRLSAVGSGSTVRVSFLKRIGGFNEMFWLDCLDRWLFLTITDMGGKIFVSDSVLDHNLSIMDYNKYMTVERYDNILRYETLFMKIFKSRAEYFVYCMRLLKRTVYLFFTVHNKKISLMTLRQLVANMNPFLK
jgi:GT2 family glycosyltransferase